MAGAGPGAGGQAKLLLQCLPVCFVLEEVLCANNIKHRSQSGLGRWATLLFDHNMCRVTSKVHMCGIWDAMLLQSSTNCMDS